MGITPVGQSKEGRLLINRWPSPTPSSSERISSGRKQLIVGQLAKVQTEGRLKTDPILLAETLFTLFLLITAFSRILILTQELTTYRHC